MFRGFSPETMDFLWGIRMNNERSWFLAHKNDYMQYLYEPMKALGEAIFRPFQEVPGLELKVSRIYRDARMHPATPYKESLWICIRRPEAMERFRRDVTARPGYFPELLERAQSASGLGLTAQPYKRPKPCPDAALAPYFSWKGDLEAIAEVPAGPALFSPALADQVGQTLESWLPVSNYFYQLTDV